MKKYIFAVVISAFSFLLAANPLYAHAFGQQYTLPVPFWLYAYAAAGAVIISFLIIGYFIKNTTVESSYPSYIHPLFMQNLLLSPAFINIIKINSILLLMLSISTGLFGNQIPSSNFNMTFSWIICVLGLTYFSALIGNIYTVLNPWKNIIEAFESVRNKSLEPLFAYPKCLYYYPACLFYSMFIWIELMGRATPLQLSILLIAYSLITFLGVFLFGKKEWLTHAEFFTVFYGLISKISPFYTKPGKTHQLEINLRPPFVGLLDSLAKDFSNVLFIMIMLSSTAYDGFKETKIWWNLYFLLLESTRTSLHDAAPIIIGTLGLILAPLVFLGIFIALLWCMKLLVHTKLSMYTLMLSFTYSLIPIALAYNVAHYYTLFVIQGQTIISLFSDPFGVGWNLFGTSRYLANLGFLSMNFIWHSQVALILIGHIASVYIAHVVAIHLFKSHKKALLSQLPLIILMVLYTMAGLWILSQPITSGY